MKGNAGKTTRKTANRPAQELGQPDCGIDLVDSRVGAAAPVQRIAEPGHEEHAGDPEEDEEEEEKEQEDEEDEENEDDDEEPLQVKLAHAGRSRRYLRQGWSCSNN